MTPYCQGTRYQARRVLRRLRRRLTWRGISLVEWAERPHTSKTARRRR